MQQAAMPTLCRMECTHRLFSQQDLIQYPPALAQHFLARLAEAHFAACFDQQLQPHFRFQLLDLH